jgi:thiamine-phosphate pyrophosphorylase
MQRQPMGSRKQDNSKGLPQGLYAITDPTLTPPEFIIEKVEQAILGGARMVQYRDKIADGARRQRQAAALLKLCNHYRIPLLVNDDVDLVRAVGAHGVHLGLDDATIREARTILGKDAIVGASCYDDFARAERACKAGADYVAFGSFFHSPTKPFAAKAGMDLLRRARRRLEIPVCAIGGITAANAAPLVEAGADLIAVISGLFAQPDPRQTAQVFATLFNNAASARVYRTRDSSQARLSQ